MRRITLSLLIVVTACGADPGSLGLTGAAVPVPPPEAPAGVGEGPTNATQFAPSAAPGTGAGKFWGYN